MSATLASLNLFVHDLPAVRDFYVRGLGLVEDRERSAGTGFCLLHAGPATLTLQAERTPGAEFGPAGSVEIGFAVPDVEAAHRQLQAAGYAPDAIEQMGWGTALSVRDPEGHRLNVFRLRA